MNIKPADTHEALLIQVKVLTRFATTGEKVSSILHARVSELEKGYTEARKTLESERAANETLTNEVTRQAEVIGELRQALNHYRSVNEFLKREVEALKEIIVRE